MNKELEQEIKDSKSLPRRERRKKELMLQKKYKGKLIRIKSGKTFKKEASSLTRKQKKITNE